MHLPLMTFALDTKRKVQLFTLNIYMIGPKWGLGLPGTGGEEIPDRPRRDVTHAGELGAQPIGGEWQKARLGQRSVKKPALCSNSTNTLVQNSLLSSICLSWAGSSPESLRN